MIAVTVLIFAVCERGEMLLLETVICISIAFGTLKLQRLQNCRQKVNKNISPYYYIQSIINRMLQCNKLEFQQSRGEYQMKDCSKNLWILLCGFYLTALWKCANLSRFHSHCMRCVSFWVHCTHKHTRGHRGIQKPVSSLSLRA